CVTGWSVDNVHWAGVRFRDLLELVRPGREAGALKFVSAERPYVDSLTLDEALLPDAMLAYEMDGKPLTQAHGAPVRLVIPEMYGYKGVKWVEQIELGTVPETRPGAAGTLQCGPEGECGADGGVRRPVRGLGLSALAR